MDKMNGKVKIWILIALGVVLMVSCRKEDPEDPGQPFVHIGRGLVGGPV